MGIFNNFAKFLSNNKQPAPIQGSAFLPTWNNINITSQKNLLEQYEYWTYKAIDIKAKAISALNIFTTNANGEKIENQIIKDLKHFNNYLSWEQGIKIAIMHLSLTGSAFLYLMPSDIKGYKYNFIPLNPLNMSITPNPITGLPISYKFRDVNGREVIYELSEVIHIYDPDPSNWTKSKGALEASSFAHNIVEFSLQYNNNIFGNMGNLKGFLMLLGAGEEQLQAFQKMFEEKFTGNINAGRTGFVDKEIKYLEIGKNPKDLDFASTLDKMRDMVLSIQGVPVDMIVGNSTYNNASEAQRIFQTYTIKPIATQITSAINRIIPIKYNDNNTIFIIENPIKKDIEKDTKIARELYIDGIITKNEARMQAGFDAIDGGDTFVQIQQLKKPIETEIKHIKKELQKSLKSLQEIEQTKIKALLEQKYLEIHMKMENLVISILEKFFNEQLQRILTGKKSAANIAIIDWNIEIDLMNKSMQEISDIIIIEYQKLTNMELGVNYSLSQNEIEQIYNINLSRSKSMTLTTKEDVNKIVADAIVGGGDKLNTIKNNLTKLFQSYKQSRIKNIAISEVTRIKNTSRSIIYNNNEFVKTLIWINSGDKRVRHSHRNIKPIRKGEKFNVGGELMSYPGDHNASAKNTIGCRCDLGTRNF